MNTARPTISMIAALARDNRAIGKDNRLLWNIPEDMRRFRTITTGHVVIMGQKTFESIGRPLPNRTNIVLTLDPDFRADGCRIVSSIDEALALAREEEKQGEVFVIGGGSIYGQCLSHADRLYLTLVEGVFEGDVFFPEYSEFAKVKERREGRDEAYRYEFVTLER